MGMDLESKAHKVHRAEATAREEAEVERGLEGIGGKAGKPT